MMKVPARIVRPVKYGETVAVTGFKSAEPEGVCVAFSKEGKCPHNIFVI